MVLWEVQASKHCYTCPDLVDGSAMDGISAIRECHSRVVVVVHQRWDLESAHVAGSVFASYEQPIMLRAASGIEQEVRQILPSVHMLYRDMVCLCSILVGVKKDRLHG